MYCGGGGITESVSDPRSTIASVNSAEKMTTAGYISYLLDPLYRVSGSATDNEASTPEWVSISCHLWAIEWVFLGFGTFYVREVFDLYVFGETEVDCIGYKLVATPVS